MKYLLTIVMAVISCSLAAQELTLQASGTELVVNANGLTAMTALQFNLELPDGTSITNDATMGDATDGHTLCMKTLDNGDRLFILYSMDLNTFKDGELLRIPLTAKSNDARLYNIRFADTDAKSYSAESATTSTTIVGDANANGEVEIGDVTSVLTLMATPEANGYDNKAADANGNGEIEIGDVTTILTIMAGE